MIFKYDELIEKLKKDEIKKIMVTGPQRSGTRFVTNVIGNDLNIEIIDELDYEIGSLKLFLDLIKDKENFSAQAPALSFYLDKIPEDITIIYMYREIGDIVSSQKRIKWNHDASYKKIHTQIFGDKLTKYNINMKKPISDIKYQIWENIQKPNIKNISFDLDYKSLEIHPMWIKRENRKKFKPSQIK